jgi:hypothetical protein
MTGRHRSGNVQDRVARSVGLLAATRRALDGSIGQGGDMNEAATAAAKAAEPRAKTKLDALVIGAA